MNIPTKFDCGESVWTIYDNKANVFEIREINMQVRIKKNVSDFQEADVSENILYGLFIPGTHGRSGNIVFVDENKLFRSKEELKESL